MPGTGTGRALGQLAGELRRSNLRPLSSVAATLVSADDGHQIHGCRSPERLARSGAVFAGADSSGGADRAARLGRACPDRNRPPAVLRSPPAPMAPPHRGPEYT